MIVFKKIAFLRPLLLHAATLMRFSEETKREQLSVSAQKAVWATSIIKTIANPTPPSTIKDPTLRDLIFNLPDPSTQFHFEKSERDKVMDLFKEGIKLAPTFLAQSRVAQAQQEMKQNQSLKKFIFFPNRSVTSPMFQQLLRYSAYAPSSILLTGGYGISKTVSIILFIHLSYHQTLYAYQTLKDKEKMKEYNKLIQMNLLPKKAPKYWYWSAKYNTEKRIINLLVDQAVQIEQNIKDQLKQETSLEQFIIKLANLYQVKNITSRPIIDQFHQIASALRNQNKLYQIHYPTSVIPGDSTGFKYLQLLRKILLLGSNFTLNSSITIEIDILKKGSEHKLAFGFYSSHTNFSITHIPYERSITTKEGQIDFWQTFWFEMERRMKIESKTEAQIAAAKQTFNNNAQHVQLSKLAGFNKFIYVKTFLDTSYSLLLKALKQQSDELIQAQLQNFKYHCVKDQFKKMKQYLRKENTREKELVLIKILAQAEVLRHNEQRWTAQFKLTKEKMEYIIFGSLPNERKEVRDLSEMQAFTDLKPFLISWDKDIQFNLTAAQLDLLIFPLFFNIEDIAYYIGQPDTNMRAFIQRKGIRAALIQIYLIRLLCSSGTMGFRANQITGKKSVQKVFIILKWVDFEPINDLSKYPRSQKNKQTQNLQQQSSIQNFRYAIEQAKKHKDEDILALPYVIVNGHQMRYTDNSATIDFLIIRYSEELNKLYISTFDPTVTGDLNEKIINARNLLRKLIATQDLDKEIEIEIDHTILITDDTPTLSENLLQESNDGIIEAKVNIYLAKMELLSLNSKDTLSLQSFNQILNLYTMVSEEEKRKIYFRELIRVRNKLKIAQKKLQQFYMQKNTK